MIQEHNISFRELHVSPGEVYEAMGYGSGIPEEDVREMVNAAIEKAASFIVPRFTYFITNGILDKTTLLVNDVTLNIGHIIGKQLTGSDAFAFFTATAGQEFEQWTEELKQSGDIVQQYITDSLGSCLAEASADYMEAILQKEIAGNNQKHTGRFSPGYCEWDVSEQQKLFSLFPSPAPCGIRLTSSGLMIPIKSVSGVIGVGSRVKKLEYTCGLCTFERCYKKKSTP